MDTACYIVLNKVKGGYMRVDQPSLENVDEVNKALSKIKDFAGRTLVVVKCHPGNIHEGDGGVSGYVIPIRIFATKVVDDVLVMGEQTQQVALERLTLVD